MSVASRLWRSVAARTRAARCTSLGAGTGFDANASQGCLALLIALAANARAEDVPVRDGGSAQITVSARELTRIGMADGITSLMPEARTGHVGLYRNEETLEPVEYYCKLPEDIAAGPVFLVDPMLATGGSAIAAVRLLEARGCRDIRLVCLVAAPEGAAAMAQQCPNVAVFTAALDRQLNDLGYILPGLGDAGDRIFGTR